MKSIINWLLYLWRSITYRLIKPVIKVTRVSLSGDKNFLDIRYWLSRPDKVKGVFPVSLVDENTGEQFQLMRIAKYGIVRTKHKNKFHHSGIMLFRNRNNAIQSGSKVTVIFGSLQANHVKVN